MTLPLPHCFYCDAAVKWENAIIETRGGKVACPRCHSDDPSRGGVPASRPIA
jgi:hypothetical protein